MTIYAYILTLLFLRQPGLQAAIFPTDIVIFPVHIMARGYFLFELYVENRAVTSEPNLVTVQYQ